MSTIINPSMNDHNLFFDNGQILAIGSNNFGQLGLGDSISRTLPTPISFLSSDDIVSTSTGKYHSLFLNSEGKVLSCGSGWDDRLGLNDSEHRYLPTLIPNLFNITAICAGDAHSLFLDLNGNVFSCGANHHGQLGLGNNHERKIPTKIPNLENIIAISAGYAHSMCLDRDGNAWGFGNNYNGESRCFACGRGHTRDTGAKRGLGDCEDRNVPVVIPKFTEIAGISVGGYHTMFLDKNDKIWVCGSNCYGQSRCFACGRGHTRDTGAQRGLSDNKNVNEPKQIDNLSAMMQISAGHDHSLVLDKDGNMWSFGRNGNGELGLGHENNINVATKIETSVRVREIKAGNRHSLMVDEEGKVWCFGGAYEEKRWYYDDVSKTQLGLGENIKDTNVPTLVESLKGRNVHLH